MRKRIRHPVRLVLLVLLISGIALTVWSIWGTGAPMTSHVTVSSSRLPDGFEGFRIAHISDLHNAEFGEENSRLLELLEGTRPDLIAMTGDIIDAHHTDVEVALRFAQAAVKIAPVFYVTGNHEASTSAYAALKEGFQAAGVRILEDAAFPLERNGDTLFLLGLQDPRFELRGHQRSEERAMMETKIRRLQEETGEGFQILLSHRPELFSTYVSCGLDLVLSGHAHGGQVRIPFVGGLVAPDQGFFPRYDAGLYTEGHTNMVVSRGIGNSVVPLRVNNRPEIVLVELRQSGEN